jgi:hypothetical protein
MDINTALHTMAAHLHRYKAEVDIMRENVEALATHLGIICSPSCPLRNNRPNPSSGNHSLDALAINIKGLINFIAELEVKTNTVIALVSTTMPIHK